MKLDVRVLPLRAIKPHHLNPRDDLGDLRGLTEDIAADGIIEPLVVIPGSHGKETGECGDCEQQVDRTTSGILVEHAVSGVPCPGGSETAADEWLIVCGHRRHAAAVAAQLREAPCVVRWDLHDRPDVVLMMLRENIHRRSLAPWEEARGYQQLSLEGMTATRIAQQTRQAKKHVDRRLALKDLPEKSTAQMKEGRLTLDDAYSILGLPPEAEQNVLRSVGTKEFKQEVAREHLRLVSSSASDRDVAARLREDFLRPLMDGATRPPESPAVWREVVTSLADSLPQRAVRGWLGRLGKSEPTELASVAPLRALIALAVTLERSDRGLYSLLQVLGYEPSPIEAELLEGA